MSFRQSMNRFRVPLLIAAAVVALVLIGLAVLFSTGFQTWAARRALASRPDIRGTIGSVSAGLGRIEVRDVRLEKDGAVLTLPLAEAELPVLSAAFGDKVLLSHLSAKGWTLDLTNWRPAAPAAMARPVVSQPAAGGAAAGPGAIQPKAAAPVAANAKSASATGTQSSSAARAAPPPQPGFDGVFDHLQLPFDVALDGVELNGEIVLPAGRGRAQVRLAGGGLGPGRPGRFTFGIEAALNDPKVSAAGLRGNVVAELDTPRTVRRVAITAEATAAGTQFPNGIRLAVEAAAAHSANGETYSLGVISEGREVVALQAELPRNTPLLTGTWKANVRHGDLAPFAMGRTLPEFTVAGEGRFDADAAFAAVHAAGRASGTAGELGALMPQLSAVGPVKWTADFDLGRRGEAISVRTLEADLAGDGPIARLQALQAFEFNPATAELKAENAERELFDVVLQGVPVAWVRAFMSVPEVTVSGGNIRGELVATMRAGGTTLRTKAPLTLGGISVAHAGKPLLAGVDVLLKASGDYTPHGWQAEVGELIVRHADATLVTVAAKAGQLPGNNQPMKATGRLTADLVSILAQPAAAGMLTLTRGEAAVDFVASLGATQEIQAKLALTGLAAPASPPTDKSANADPAAARPVDETLPAITADLRADIAADGLLAFNAPIQIERNARKSDVTIGGTLKSAKDVRTFDAQVTSEQLVIDDAKVMASVLPPDRVADESTPEAKPPWAGYRGSLGLRLKKVIYSDSFVASDVAGTLRLDESGMRIDGLRMGVGEGDAQLQGAVTFNAYAAPHYELAANLALRDFDPGPLLRALNPGQLPTVEGRFTVKSDVTAHAPALGQLAGRASGVFEITSRGGVFRGLPVNVGNLVENSGKLAGWLASAGSAIGALTGKKDFSDVTSKAQAVAELTKGLNPLPFDQLSVVLSRDAAQNTTMKDFALISPEIRLTGEGRLTHDGGTALLDDALSIEFRLRARGRQGELLKYLGMLEPQPDNLGYSGCTLPLKVGGTLRAPDTSELNQRLVALALEKSGVGDKAAELLQKFRMSRPSGE